MKKFAFLLAGLVLFAYFFGLGGPGLMDPDEGRYGEIPREMIETGDYITPRLNYVKYFEKPVLHYWLTAASFLMFGQGEFASRLVPVLCAVCGIWVTFLTARRMRGESKGKYPDAEFYAVVVLSTCLLWFAIARINILDMTVSFFITLSLAGFWRGQNAGGDRKYLLLFYAGMALATLTKGLIGIVLPGGIVFWYIVLTRRWRLFLHTLYWPGIVLFFVLSVPWFWAVCRVNDDFFYFFFVQEHFLRYTTRMHNRYEPVWFFIPILIGGLVPWTGLLSVMGRKFFRRDDAEKGNVSEHSGLFLVLWFAIPFIFFSVSNSKLIPYIVPCLPPLAILAGRALSLVAKGEGAGRFVHVNGALLSLLAVAGCVYPSMDDAFGPSLLYVYTLPASAGFAAMALCGWFFHFKRAHEKMVRALCVLAFVNVLVLSRGFYLAAVKESYKEPVALIQERFGPLAPEDVVVSYKNTAQGLGFYLGRRIVLTGSGGELEFGARQEKDPRWFLGDAELGEKIKALWDGESKVVLVTSRRREKEIEGILGENNMAGAVKTRFYLLLSNR